MTQHFSLLPVLFLTDDEPEIDDQPLDVVPDRRESFVGQGPVYGLSTAITSHQAERWVKGFFPCGRGGQEERSLFDLDVGAEHAGLVLIDLDLDLIEPDLDLSTSFPFTDPPHFGTRGYDPRHP